MGLIAAEASILFDSSKGPDTRYLHLPIRRVERQQLVIVRLISQYHSLPPGENIHIISALIYDTCNSEKGRACVTNR